MQVFELGVTLLKEKKEEDEQRCSTKGLFTWRRGTPAQVGQVTCLGGVTRLSIQSLVLM